MVDTPMASRDYASRALSGVVDKVGVNAFLVQAYPGLRIRPNMQTRRRRDR